MAHSYWSQILQPGDTAVDATSGNGHDTLFLAERVLTPTKGTLYAFDIQSDALEQTRKRIEEALPQCAHRLHLLQQSHENFPEEFHHNAIKLFVYNLGYLPGANKAMTTLTTSTVNSVDAACALVAFGGLISITCYPGHPEGAMEEQALLELVEKLDKTVWNVCHHRWVNREKSPSLLLLQKNQTI